MNEGPLVNEASYQARVGWEAIEALPAAHITHFVTQIALPVGNSSIPEGLFIGGGQLIPPVMLTEADVERASSAGSLALHPVFRMFLTYPRLVELIDLLTVAKGKFESQAGDTAEADEEQLADPTGAQAQHG